MIDKPGGEAILPERVTDANELEWRQQGLHKDGLWPEKLQRRPNGD